jgi:hypothetical protein
MRALKGAIQRAMGTLTRVTHVQLEATNERAIWRRQLRGRPNPLAQNVMGEDPKGLFWRTTDRIVPVKHQGPDDLGRTIFFSNFEPVYGDLIITLVGQPQTDEAAQHATRKGYYRIVEFDVRRDPTGRLMSAKIWAEPDRSGKWGEG